MLEIPELNTLMGTNDGRTYLLTPEYRETLKAALDAADVPVSTIAKELHLSRDTIYGIIRGDRPTINRRTYNKLAQLDKKGEHRHE